MQGTIPGQKKQTLSSSTHSCAEWYREGERKAELFQGVGRAEKEGTIAPGGGVKLTAASSIESYPPCWTQGFSSLRL